VNVLPDPPIVCCISEGRADGRNFHEIQADIVSKIRTAAPAGVNLFQIREKSLSAAKLFELAESAVLAARGSGVKVILNGRADIAMAANADGVHLPGDGIPAAALRDRVPDGFIIGVSTHSTAEALAARDGGADYITYSPVFDSPGKGASVGLRALAEVCEAIAPLPLVALGGVDGTNIQDVLKHGAAGYAAIRYLNALFAETTESL
jgi:thiamine-phosphate pyrophosphorylase